MSDNKGALIVTRRPARELADGTLRVTVDVEPNDRKQFLAMFPDNGDPICVARLSDEVIRQHRQETAFAEAPKTKGEHGHFARWLMQSGFFRRPEVWKSLGFDKDYLDWLREQPCLLAGKQSEEKKQRCMGDVVPAHVRLISEGAGTAVKPKYCAVPLCDNHHKLQHQHGYSEVGGKEFLAEKRIAYVQEWSKELLKKLIGVKSLAAIDVSSVQHFCEVNGIKFILPRGFEND